MTVASRDVCVTYAGTAMDGRFEATTYYHLAKNNREFVKEATQTRGALEERASRAEPSISLLDATAARVFSPPTNMNVVLASKTSLVLQPFFVFI